jgi:hypothetical protein
VHSPLSTLVQEHGASEREAMEGRNPQDSYSQCSASDDAAESRDDSSTMHAVAPEKMQVSMLHSSASICLHLWPRNCKLLPEAPWEVQAFASEGNLQFQGHICLSIPMLLIAELYVSLERAFAFIHRSHVQFLDQPGHPECLSIQRHLPPDLTCVCFT